MISKTNLPRQQVPDTTLTPLRRARHTWQPETNTIITSMALWSYWRAIRRSPSVGRSARIGMMTRGGIACRGTLNAMASTASRIPDAMCRRKKTFRVFDWILSSLLALIFSDRWKFTWFILSVSNQRSKQRIGFNPLHVASSYHFISIYPQIQRSMGFLCSSARLEIVRSSVSSSPLWEISEAVCFGQNAMAHGSVSKPCTPGEHQHTVAGKWMFIPLKNGINRYWPNPTWQTTRMQCQFATTRKA